MYYIFKGLSFFVIPIIVGGVLAFLRSPKKGEKGRVYLPKFFVVLGIIISVITIIPAVITLMSDESIWATITLLVFSILGACLIIAFANCRISYDENGFVSKGFFGVKRKFTYEQVTAIQINMHETYIYIGKQRVMVDEFAIGGGEFVDYVRKRYRTIYKGNAIPVVRKTKCDIFNGNVEDVFGFMFAYISVGVMIIAFAVFLVWYILFSPATQDNTVKQEVSFTSYTESSNEIILTSADKRIFKLKFMGDGFDSSLIKSICNGKTVVTVYSKEITPKEEEHYYSVKAIQSGDEYILSFDETNARHREEYWPLIFFPIVSAIIWGGFVTASIIVGRNPRKYSKKVVALFFKSGYVRY